MTHPTTPIDRLDDFPEMAAIVIGLIVAVPFWTVVGAVVWWLT